MKVSHFVAGCMFLVMAGAAVADASPGTPRREFHGRVYFLKSTSHYSPVWYEANGIIATRRQKNTPLWPDGQFNKIY